MGLVSPWGRQSHHVHNGVREVPGVASPFKIHTGSSIPGFSFHVQNAVSNTSIAALLTTSNFDSFN